MTEYRRIGHRSAWLAIAVTGSLLTGCAEPGTPSSATGGRVFAVDQTGGARKCDAPRPDLTDGKTSEVKMTVSNDGGWCGIVAQRGGRPYDSGLLPVRPDNGKLLVHRVGDITRITYTPTRGYVGPDKFTVKLIPGDAVVNVTVAVTAP